MWTFSICYIPVCLRYNKHTKMINEYPLWNFPIPFSFAFGHFTQKLVLEKRTEHVANIPSNIVIANPLKMWKRKMCGHMLTLHSIHRTSSNICYGSVMHENNSDNDDRENGKKWSEKSLISIVFVLSCSCRSILYNEDTFINVKTWARATKQVDAYENEGIAQWCRMTSLIEPPELTEALTMTAAVAAVTTQHIKFSASNVTYCENESNLIRSGFLFVHGSHSYIVCIEISPVLASACAKNQINFIAFSCLILSTVECYLWPCIPDDNTTDKPINLYLSGAASPSKMKKERVTKVMV